MKSESIVNLIQATIKVMEEVKGIDKTMTIGTGAGAYKGVPDQEVKKVIGESMAKNGLAIYVIDIDEDTQIDQWDEAGAGYTKRKQQIFTKVKVTYMLCHESGEFITLKSIGHGVDSQDKSAGKAMTYALKYQLLYTFLVPTGKIDDADAVHSDSIPVAEVKKQELTDAEKVKIDQMLIHASDKLNECMFIEDVVKVYELLPSLHENKTALTPGATSLKLSISKKL